MLIRFILLSFFISATVSIANAQNNLKIYNKDASKSLQLFFTDLFGDDLFVSVPADSIKKINIDNIELLTKYNVPYLMFAGDSIEFNADSVYVKNNKIRTNELYFFKALIQKFGELKFVDLPDKPYSEYSKEEQNQLIAKRDSVLLYQLKAKTKFLENYAKEHAISKEFKQYCEVYFEYDHILKRIQLLTKDKRLLKVIDRKYPEELFKYKNKFAHDEYLNNINYRRAIRYYAAFVDMYFPDQMLEDVFYGKSDQYILFNNIKSKFNLYTVTKKEIETYYKKSNDTLFNKYIYNLELANDAIRNNKEKNLLQAGTIKADSYSSIINSYKGKVILIDFWASWCAPCIADIPYVQKLEKELGRSGFVVVHISMDENKNLWEKASKVYDFHEKNFLLLSNFRSPLATNLKLKTIPKYVLVDKKGQYINIDAFKPSSLEFKEQINKALN